MAALWGDNHERDIRDAMWNNTVHWWKMFFLIAAIVVTFTSPAWLWLLT